MRGRSSHRQFIIWFRKMGTCLHFMSRQWVLITRFRSKLKPLTVQLCVTLFQRLLASKRTSAKQAIFSQCSPEQQDWSVSVSISVSIFSPCILVIISSWLGWIAALHFPPSKCFLPSVCASNCHPSVSHSVAFTPPHTHTFSLSALFCRL